MIRPVAYQTGSARIRRHHQVTETRQTKTRSADRPTGPITPILAQDGWPRWRPGCRTDQAGYANWSRRELRYGR